MKSLGWTFIILLCSALVKAEQTQERNGWIIIVNEATGIISLEKKQVMSLFLGRAKFLPSGHKAIAYDYPYNSKERTDFYMALTGKSIVEIDAYWARLKYSGRASPPNALNDLQIILKNVETVPGGIAYIPINYERSISGRNVKTVLTFFSY